MDDGLGAVAPAHHAIYLRDRTSKLAIDAVRSYRGSEFARTAYDCTICVRLGHEAASVIPILSETRTWTLGLALAPPVIHVLADDVDCLVGVLEQLDKYTAGLFVSVVARDGSAEAESVAVKLRAIGCDAQIAILSGGELLTGTPGDVATVWDVSPAEVDHESVVEIVEALCRNGRLGGRPRPGFPCGVSAFVRTAGLLAGKGLTRGRALPCCLAAVAVRPSMRWLAPVCCPYCDDWVILARGYAACQQCDVAHLCICCPLAATTGSTCVYRGLLLQEDLVASLRQVRELRGETGHFSVLEHDWDYQYVPPDRSTREPL